MCMNNFHLPADLAFCSVVEKTAKLKPLMLLHTKRGPLVFSKTSSYLGVKANGIVSHSACLKPSGNMAVGIILIRNTFATCFESK